MDTTQIPPQLLGVDPQSALMAGQSGQPPPGFDPMAGAAAGQPPPNPMMGMMQGALPGMQGAAMGGPLGAAPTPPMDGAMAPDDPILAQLLQQVPLPPIDPEILKPKSERKGYRRKPDTGYMEEAVVADHLRHQRLIDRFAKDLELWRQEHADNLPPMFDRFREVAWKAATISNIVTKLANMLSASDWKYVVPFQGREIQRKLPDHRELVQLPS